MGETGKLLLYSSSACDMINYWKIQHFFDPETNFSLRTASDSYRLEEIL